MVAIPRSKAGISSENKTFMVLDVEVNDIKVAIPRSKAGISRQKGLKKELKVNIKISCNPA